MLLHVSLIHSFSLWKTMDIPEFGTRSVEGQIVIGFMAIFKVAKLNARNY